MSSAFKMGIDRKYFVFKKIILIVSRNDFSLFSYCKFQVSHQKVNMTDRCTKFNFQEYWCPVKSDMNKNSSTYLSHGLRSGRPFPWGVCDMSCLENFNKSSVILTMEISPELMNSMTIAEEIDEDTTYKGQISDLYIWDR